MRRIILIFVVVLLIFVLVGGCGGGGGYSSGDNETTIHYDVDVTDWAAVMHAQTEQQRMWMEQGERSKQSMYNTIDQMFGIPPSRPYEPYGHHRH